MKQPHSPTSMIILFSALIILCLPGLSSAQLDYYYNDTFDSYNDRRKLTPDNHRYRNDNHHPGWGLFDAPDYEKNTYGNDFDDDYVSDTELYNRIRMRLAMNPFADRKNIRIHVVNGNVTLAGTVVDRSAMVDVIEIAFDSGAWKVRNRLNIRKNSRQNWKNMSDVELREEIKEELMWSPFVDSERINVSVKNGVATLYGRVENKEEINDAVINAYEAGAKRVKNRLWVEIDHS